MNDYVFVKFFDHQKQIEITEFGVIKDIYPDSYLIGLEGAYKGATATLVKQDVLMKASRA